MPIRRGTFALKIVGGLAAVAMLAAGCGVQTSDSVDPVKSNVASSSDLPGGRTHEIKVTNALAEPIDVAFTLNEDSANGFEAPHCTYPQGVNNSATTLQTRIPAISPHATAQAGTVENRNSGNCNSQQSYVGVSVTVRSGTYFGLMQMSNGEQIARLSNWQRGNPKAQPPANGKSALAPDSPMLVMAVYDSGTYEVLVREPDAIGRRTSITGALESWTASATVGKNAKITATDLDIGGGRGKIGLTFRFDGDDTSTSDSRGSVGEQFIAATANHFSYFGNSEALSPDSAAVASMTSFGCGPLKVPGAQSTLCIGRNASNRIFFGGPGWGYHIGDNPVAENRNTGGQLCQELPSGICITQSNGGTNTGELWALGCNVHGPKVADATLGCLFPNKQLKVAADMKALCKNLHECALLSFFSGHQVMRFKSDGAYEVLDQQGPWPGSRLCGAPTVQMDPIRGARDKGHGELLKVYPADDHGHQTMVLLNSSGMVLNGGTFIEGNVTQQVGLNGCGLLYPMTQRIVWHPGGDKDIADQRCEAGRPKATVGSLPLTCGIAMSVTTSTEASDALSQTWANSWQGLASLSLLKSAGLYSGGELAGLLGQVAAAIILSFLLPHEVMASTAIVGPWEQ